MDIYNIDSLRLMYESHIREIMINDFFKMAGWEKITTQHTPPKWIKKFFEDATENYDRLVAVIGVTQTWRSPVFTVSFSFIGNGNPVLLTTDPSLITALNRLKFDVEKSSLSENEKEFAIAEIDKTIDSYTLFSVHEA